MRKRPSGCIKLGAATTFLFALAACSADAPDRVSAPSEFSQEELIHNAEDMALQKLGRGVALALTTPSARLWIRKSIDQSPYVEWRIPLNRVLLNDGHGPEMRRILEQVDPGERSPEALQRLPDLELYFPIPEHRNRWTPDQPVQVAVRISHSERYTIFSTDGKSSLARESDHPTVATLVLAPSEIEYDDIDLSLRGGSRSGSGFGAPRGMYEFHTILGASYMTAETTLGADVSQYSHLGWFRTSYNHDGGLSGSDEVEVFGSIDGGYKACVRKANVSKDLDYYFDINQLGTTVAKAIPTSPSTVYIDAVEDDDGYCIRRSADDPYGQVSVSLANFGQNLGTSNPGQIAIRLNATPAP
jgi:hypothetical protein